MPNTTINPTNPLRMVFSVEGLPSAAAFFDVFAPAGADGGYARDDRGAELTMFVVSAATRSLDRLAFSGGRGVAVRGLGMRIAFPHPSQFTTFPIHSSVAVYTRPHWLHRYDNAIVTHSTSAEEADWSLSQVMILVTGEFGRQPSVGSRGKAA